MIKDTSATDRPIERRGPGRRAWAVGATALGLVAVGALVYPSASRWMRAAVSADAARLRMATVARGDIVRDVSVQGRIVAAFHPTLFSPEAGTLRMLVKAGDPIVRDQELAIVDSPDLRNLLEREESSLQSARAELERQRILARQADRESRQQIALLEVTRDAAERAWKRAQETRDAGILNEVDYEKAQDDLRVKGLELDNARQKADLDRETLKFDIRSRELQVDRQRLVVEDARRQVGELTLRAPFAGLVSRVDVKDHDTVTKGQPVLAVVDLSAFEVEILVPENYADEIAPGTEAAIKYDGRDYPGRVKNMSPEVESSQVKGTVVFTGTAPEALKQNQRVSTRVILGGRTDVLKVERGPFLENFSGRKAYVIEGDLAVLRPIETGAVSVSNVEILSGLEEGDRIIISDTTRFQGAETILIRH